jgi:hypothetical protein
MTKRKVSWSQGESEEGVEVRGKDASQGSSTISRQKRTFWRYFQV